MFMSQLKKKVVRCNQSPFMKKELLKSIMIWTLHYKYSEDDGSGIFTYKIQNRFVKLQWESAIFGLIDKLSTIIIICTE